MQSENIYHKTKYSAAYRRVILLAVGIFLLGALACEPSIEEISGATLPEIRNACRALAQAEVGYDYWRLDPLAVPGRTMEVAAAIHTVHPGPTQTQEYCHKGQFGESR